MSLIRTENGRAALTFSAIGLAVNATVLLTIGLALPSGLLG